ncbi:hypothetical protein CGGC5_v010289 [Colletotrichum fructicola Nara gc5]|uniref:Uncharacterized protein n=1 Tax=Colletotrichum fructicola (strain Nara gc5) TaxID=1213859 RepID=A0A7J6IW95_COLFN|nr:hypothetical protein CGGC5_v013044 [Colletotrichum fructicola Nara gc5]KAF4480850.1 hypothetical protein CGGC5_v010289 [Colletotrichum fructicola Nara gc5]
MREVQSNEEYENEAMMKQLITRGTVPQAYLTGLVGPQNPCGGGEVINQEGFPTWGCGQFMADEGFTVLRTPGKKVDV